jgi:hypothetical protein
MSSVAFNRAARKHVWDRMQSYAHAESEGIIYTEE